MSVPGLTNYVEPVPGTDVTCYLGVWDHSPNIWIFSLFDDDDELIMDGVGRLDLSGLSATPSQVARIAFLLSVEYVT